DSRQGITTWHTGVGNDWVAEFTNGKLMLKSWKGDYLHRPDSKQGVTTWHTGIGNQWTVVEHSTGSAGSTVLAAGSIISLQSDLGTWLTRCPGCVKTVNNVDASSVHTRNDPASSPTARFEVVDAGNGKIALKADSGMF